MHLPTASQACPKLHLSVAEGLDAADWWGASVDSHSGSPQAMCSFAASSVIFINLSYLKTTQHMLVVAIRRWYLVHQCLDCPPYACDGWHRR